MLFYIELFASVFVGKYYKASVKIKAVFLTLVWVDDNVYLSHDPVAFKSGWQHPCGSSLHIVFGCSCSFFFSYPSVMRLENGTTRQSANPLTTKTTARSMSFVPHVKYCYDSIDYLFMLTLPLSQLLLVVFIILFMGSWSYDLYHAVVCRLRSARGSWILLHPGVNRKRSLIKCHS